MQFFYVLVDGVKWKNASQLVTGNESHHKRFNYLFNKWNNDKIFENIQLHKLNLYKTLNETTQTIIDSTDIMNHSCHINPEFIGFSQKLHKNATKLTLIIDQNKVCIANSITTPFVNDSKEGLKLILSDQIQKSKNKIFLVGDKGYYIKKNNKDTILKTKNIIVINPKKVYKKKTYKTKNYKSKIKIIRHTQQMKDALKERIKIEHFNSIIHRSYRRLDKIYDKNIKSYVGFLNLALAVNINQHLKK